ncbi:hypothetical protein B0J14DRAFT_573697 [Halenospora varia]|nr:hypothetical protein B0J14DRAFT_573697 [Halenospora varia]
MGKVTTEITPITPASSQPASNLTTVSTSSTPSTPIPSMAISAVYTTLVYIAIGCAPTATNCPAQIGKVVTITTPINTTACPVATIATKSTTCKHHQYAKSLTSNPTRTPPAVTSKPRPSSIRRVSQKPSSVPKMTYTTVVVTSYVNIWPTGLTTITTSQTQTLTLRLTTPNPVKPTASIPMITTTRTIIISGPKITATLTILRTTPARQSTQASANKSSSADSVTVIKTKTFKFRPVKSTGVPVYPLGNSTVPYGTWTASAMVKSTGTVADL